MAQFKQVRVVKREQRRRVEEEAALKRSSAPTPARDVKDVVSGWVSEHRRRSEEFRRNYSTLLGELGLSAPRGARIA